MTKERIEDDLHRSELDPEDFNNYELLFAHADIERRIDRLAQEISQEYKDKDPVVVYITEGATFFTVDLTRRLEFKSLQMESIGIARYQGTEPSKIPIITKKLKRNVTGRHVLLLEDVLDRGITLNFVQKKLLGSRPASLKTAVLVSKVPSIREIDAPVDYIVFDNVTGWLIGYGLDVNGRFRNLTDIFVKKDTK